VHPSQLQHSRIRAALLDLEITRGVEIGSFATVPARTGLGSSASFSVALSKGLHAFLGNKIDQRDTALHVAKIEQELLGDVYYHENIYSASHGGLNVIQLNHDKSVTVKPTMVDYKKRRDLEDHVLVFFTGSGLVPAEKHPLGSGVWRRKKKQARKGRVDEFVERLMQGDFRGMGQILVDSDIEETDNPVVEKLFEAGMEAGSWGGRALDTNGCLMFILPKDKREKVKKALTETAVKLGIEGYKEIPVRFVQSGAEVLYNGDYYHRQFI
jgi:D-glycero-alpha-D-manno-heptose-7-phosphate kinase